MNRNEILAWINLCEVIMSIEWMTAGNRVRARRLYERLIYRL